MTIDTVYVIPSGEYKGYAVTDVLAIDPHYIVYAVNHNMFRVQEGIFSKAVMMAERKDELDRIILEATYQ
jgi:hypothetical protein